MTTAANKTLKARRNAPFEWRFQVMSALTPIDLTGYSFAMQLRQYGAAAAVLIDLAMTTTENAKGIRIVDAAQGRLHLVIPEADINGLPGLHVPAVNAAQAFPYDLRVVPPGGMPSVWIEGDFIVKPGVTKL
ncbi:hypothetical protein CG471_08025 [Sphingobium sp. IP1]|uniref:hypothetical protein n=1 Tax=Sphingobium sp. IP1 TaxID=2021637 RepID=UPI000C087483|nr:hypothetical protein [Sphingobium sp. IP1]PHP20338.1 hypothetical protein CG471_08025 [Sphingobium sp. IP1]